MDQNKLKVLRDIEYVIPKQCGICIHGTFSALSAQFGVCAIQQYDHLKHTGDARQLSVYRGGCCPKFTADEASIEKGLGHWGEFVDTRQFTRSNRHKTPTRY